MRLSQVVLGGLLVPAAVALAQDAAKDRVQGPAKTPLTIRVESFKTSTIIGFLGQPLGTIVRVQGIARDGGATRAKADFGKLLLFVESVNGTHLDHPVQFTYLRANAKVRKPVPGERFDYYVHEYGEFDGVVELPAALGGDGMVVANDGFHYRKCITIHRSVTTNR